MRPEQASNHLLGITRSKAKMYEYNVPLQYHIDIPRDPSRLFPLAIGLLGDYSARLNHNSVDVAGLKELRNTLNFSAYFFDSFLESRINQEIDPYLLILASASYYLCDFPGSSRVLARRLGDNHYNLECLGLEKVLIWLLKGDLSKGFISSNGIYDGLIQEFADSLSKYFSDGTGEEVISAKSKEVLNLIYSSGTPRQLLFVDLILALTQKRIFNSVWYCLPRYSGIPIDAWQPILTKESFLKEFWPAQHLLGEQGVFKGVSAIVQMPTSAGKTRATEIIIRSAFLSGRTSLAVVVAPFKALCHELKSSLVNAFHNEAVSIDELSDILQTDFEIDELLKRKQILIVTPEKLIYMIRRIPEIGKAVGLLIYDEGHQFDNGIRGVTYELLLTSLKSMVPDTIQTVLISAVISNAESINNWLNPSGSQVILGENLNPTYRTVAFSSWFDQLGRLQFVNSKNPDIDEFFVPRVIEQNDLQLKPRERKRRVFPEKEDAHSVGLYLGLKLVSNGSVAIFCGTKATAARFGEKIVDAYTRGLTVSKPSNVSNPEELERLCYLHECNLGVHANATHCARLGIFTHHGNTPHGLRLAVEHGMQEGSIRFVICTSTLTQGVNLPIRYLIVTGIYQGKERIKVRDFHNLIGRAGRSGMHTEGSIIFADPEIYDKRKNKDEEWRWSKVKELLEPNNSEPCASTLMSIFKPLHSDDHKYTIKMEPLSFAQIYVNTPAELNNLPNQIAKEHADKNFTASGLETQIKEKICIISAIESYLMAHWEDTGLGLNEDDVMVLAKGTLAYHLSTEDNRNHIIELFKLLAKNVETNVPDSTKRRVFGSTLYGVRDSLIIEEWVRNNIEQIEASQAHRALLETLWPIFVQQIRNPTFRKCTPGTALKELTFNWLQGNSFQDLYAGLMKANCKIISGKRQRTMQIEHVVEICENALSYDGMLFIGAIIEAFRFVRPDNEEIIENLQALQKRLRYGLASPQAIIFYEIGFADRVVASDLSTIIDTAFTRKELLEQIPKFKNEIEACLNKYPAYFKKVFRNLY